MVYIYLADGFEETEALTVVDVLRRGDVEVETVSMNQDYFVTGSHNITIKADRLFSDCCYSNCEMMVLPGGMPGSENLEKHNGLKNALVEFNENEREIAAICAAPMVFGTHGFLKGKKATIYPGMEELLIGANATGEGVTCDGNITTGQGPAKAMEFALTLLEKLKGTQIRQKVSDGLLF